MEYCVFTGVRSVGKVSFAKREINHEPFRISSEFVERATKPNLFGFSALHSDKTSRSQKGKTQAVSFEQKDLFGRTVEQHGVCGFVFFGACLKEHQIGRKECKNCKWKVVQKQRKNVMKVY